ncbi:hypothetical protein FBUS_00500 [Fasciolopsis buskii]|uniref:G-protein coupled receptors family 1 profile domain-containing protein n=1 Tax=Fasciolopsis buskii TaxID=27845 RepID=A0A8E0VEX0_9TREM|nr:hypothetical protein FBUS_00500 [Fasciolopsis buski]
MNLNYTEPTNQTISLELHFPVRITFLVYSILLILFGCSGNVMLLTTLVYKQRRQQVPTRFHRSVSSQSSTGGTMPRYLRPGRGYFTSTADYLLFLVTLCEFCCIWVVVLRYTVHLALGYDLRTRFKHGCVIQKFLTSFFTHVFVALLCVFLAQRAFSMRCPLLARKVITRFRLNCCLASILVFISLKHVPVLFIYADVKNSHTTNCATQPGRIAVTMDQVYRLFDFITHSVIGYGLMVVLNAVLYSALRKSRLSPLARNTRIINSPKPEILTDQKCNVGISRRGLAASRIILCLSISQVISSIPYFVLIELFHMLKLNWLTPRNQLAIYYVCVFILFTNYVINYFVVLAVSSRIRQTSMKMLSGLLRRTVNS